MVCICVAQSLTNGWYWSRTQKNLQQITVKIAVFDKYDQHQTKQKLITAKRRDQVIIMLIMKALIFCTLFHCMHAHTHAHTHACAHTHTHRHTQFYSCTHTSHHHNFPNPSPAKQFVLQVLLSFFSQLPWKRKFSKPELFIQRCLLSMRMHKNREFTQDVMWHQIIQWGSTLPSTSNGVIRAVKRLNVQGYSWHQ